jgi:hypothetical protein
MTNETIDTKTSSITVKKMAKGYQWDVKVYFDASNDDHNEVLKAISVLEESLKATYGEQ